MKILVSITSYHKDKEKYLSKILRSYEDISVTLECKIDIILSTNYEFKFDYSGNIMHITTNYVYDSFWEYTWQNKKMIFSIYSDYDYIIESDDDILISEKNIVQYIKLKNIDENYIPGFLVTERGSDNIEYIQSILYGNTVGQLNTINNKLFFIPRNLHSACYMIDKQRMSDFLLSNENSTIPRSLNSYDCACTSVCEVYFYYKKVIEIDEINNHTVNHLPNKYINGKYDSKYFPNPIHHKYRSVEFWQNEIKLL
jgi:hypothetical protein